jgi:hypothetical protein
MHSSSPWRSAGGDGGFQGQTYFFGVILSFILLVPQGLFLSSNSRRKETKKTASPALDDPLHFSTEKE